MAQPAAPRDDSAEDALVSRAVIAAELGVSRETVRLLEVSALRKVGEGLRERLGETAFSQLRELLGE